MISYELVFIFRWLQNR